MSRLERALRRLIGCLTGLDLHFAVAGGLAVSARTEPRFTRDADVCVALDADAEVESLVGRLREWDYRVLAIVEQEAVGRIATVRLLDGRDGEEGVVLDLLFASSGIEREVVESADHIELFDRLHVPVAGVPALLAQKVLARDDVTRPQDRVDIVRLLAVASGADVEEAERLLGLIQARGFARRRDLLGDFLRIRAAEG